jgi:hypothetical protein
MKILIAISCLISLAACNLKDEKQTSSLLKKDLVRQQSKEALIERGKYLMITSACHDCHTPKVMTPHGPALDSARLLSGHPQNEQIPPIVNTNDWVLFGMGLTSAVGPWGVSFSANLTPDDTGTGNWTLEQFKTAIRKGKYKGLQGSRDLLPPMPWEMYKNMTDEDLTAIFTYLQSIPPVQNLVPAPIPPNKMQLTSNK